MSVPGRRESAALLLSFDPPAWHLRHSRAVAETAGWLALRAASAGRSLDRRLVESGALLHDLDKLPAVKASLDGLRHGDATASWLSAHGYEELGPVIAGHPVTRLADASWFEDWLAGASPEALIVAYSDKRAGQKLESMAERFGSWKRRYPPEEQARRTRGSWSVETVAAVWERAERLERRVCEIAGCSPQEVRRLRWTDAAIRAGTAAPAATAAPASSAKAGR